MHQQGKIIDWKDDRGFGFILLENSNRHVFIHINSFLHGHRRPVLNDLVSFELTTDSTGRVQASRVKFVSKGAVSLPTSESDQIDLFFLAASAFFTVLAVLVYLGYLPFALFGVYLFISAVTFAEYALDKSAAKKNRWRTSEKTLHILSLVGGWPGALAAQRMLRHKNKKYSFQWMFWCTVFLNLCGLVGLLATGGANAMLVFLSQLGG